MPPEGGQRILVTGALGQIGTELVLALRERYGSDDVVASDIREMPDSVVAKTGPFIILDVTDKNALQQHIEEWNVGIVYHLAALLSATGERNPTLCWEINMGGLLNVLEIAKARGIQVFAPSSIAVFGPDLPPVVSQDASLHPTTIYGVTKVSGEILADYYRLIHGVDVRGLRYPGLISWKAPPGGGTTDYAVEIFHEGIEKGAYRGFVRADTRLPMMYMDDAIRGTIELMEAEKANLSRGADYNFAALSFSADELTEAIVKHLPELKVDWIPDERQKYADSWPDEVDDSSARTDWGWVHEFDLESMVKDMLDNLLIMKREV